MVKVSERKGADHDLFQDHPPPVKGWITAHCDGGSRGNPGPSGYGVLIEDNAGVVLAELAEFLGRRTNNYAEYSALLAALNFAVKEGHPRLRVISDSELMVKQVKGLYRVNSPDLKPLHEEARHRMALLEGFEIRHVLREKNPKADELANLAMDRGTGRSNPSLAAAQSAVSTSATKPQGTPARIRGFVQGGTVHLLDGAHLPEGVFVTITPE
ncbi:MAG TPA: ribonuclease HI family protein [Acidisarcina sp.]